LSFGQARKTGISSSVNIGKWQNKSDREMLPFLH
jgi:hypothetical protein